MKSKTLLASGAVLMAAWMTSGQVFAQSPDTNKRTIHPDVSGPGASKGGSQSERARETGVPLPEGSPHSGTVEMGKSRADARGNGGSTDNIRAVQQALKDKGYDPGRVDGVMGARTLDAIKSFQTASNLQPTGSLNAETAEKLGVQTSGSQGSSRSSTGSIRPRDAVKSSDTTVGKDSDQPNQTPKK